jgi:hypothetical protein
VTKRNPTEGFRETLFDALRKELKRCGSSRNRRDRYGSCTLGCISDFCVRPPPPLQTYSSIETSFLLCLPISDELATEAITLAVCISNRSVLQLIPILDNDKRKEQCPFCGLCTGEQASNLDASRCRWFNYSTCSPSDCIVASGPFFSRQGAF